MAKRKAPKKNQQGILSDEAFTKIWNAHRARNGLPPVILKISAKRYV